ncbi:TspO protein [Corynebacterium yudongzhengii]|uniref:Tryptophan-rich sensory protein n=1 Tax=Corynebacterium yudongzhengii TaxID=2080740 RepID=A0A2U1T6S3_9CORY|nr:TspO/MBR family protein [Corynebacterium yudongzhengii]AWB82224.1 TspO protein [Corynebacterium yudongzhengii]PWC01673.1 tryptophan-rich sensory protein [Corynebacterium yudongzhengii]
MAKQKTAKKRWKNIGLAAGLTTVTAVVGSLATDPNSKWYKELDTPPWQPPTWAFPVAWTGLYAAIAASSAHVLNKLDRAGGKKAADKRRSFINELTANLVLNAGWSILFFQGKKNVVSAVEAALLALSSARLARKAGTITPAAGWALTPYVAWTSFATALTVEIARRNQ